MFCPKCGATLKDGAKFCHACGFTLVDPAVNAQPQPQQPQQQFQNPYQNMSGAEAKAAASNIFTRAINIMFSPVKEWKVIENEIPNTNNILFMYVLPLALIPAIFTFIGTGLIGYTINFGWGMGSYTYRSIPAGIAGGITSLISTFGAVLLTALIVDALAPSFKVQKNFGKAMQLVAYSMTPLMIGGIFHIYNPIAFLAFLTGIYGLVLLYWGFEYTMKPSKDSTVGYYLATLGIMLVVYIVLALVIGLILTAIFVPSVIASGMDFNMPR